MSEQLKRKLNDQQITIQKQERVIADHRSLMSEVVAEADAGFPQGALNKLREHLKDVYPVST